MRKAFQRILTLLLAVCLALSLAGCSYTAYAAKGKKPVGRFTTETKAGRTASETEAESTEASEAADIAENDEAENAETAAEASKKTGNFDKSAGTRSEDPEDVEKTEAADEAKSSEEAEGPENAEAAQTGKSSEAAETKESSEDAEDPEEAEAAEKDSVLDHLPKTGEEIHGFEVTDITDFPQKNAKIVSMDHIKSGAQLIYIACDDPDKAFTITYRTSAENDKGIPHVFEHITLSGSGKYPSATLWDEIESATYNTFMNASTWQHMTNYLMSSLSEDQLLAIMDFYMSGLTDPLALRDEHPLKREAYRFELNSPEEEISVTGAVFNEMEAANSNLDSFACEAANKLLYPSSIMSFNSGGYRDDIITISLEELKSFYQKHYHPSNMLIAMYGDMDYTRFLEALDRDYLSHYEKREIEIRDEKYVPWTGYREAVIPYPVTEDSSAENGSVVRYSISMGDMNVYDRQLMQVIAVLLSSEDSLLKQKMEKEFPESSFGAEFDFELQNPAFTFTLQDAPEGEGEHFRTTIIEALDEIIENGLNKANIEAIVNQQKLSTILSAEEPGGINVCQQFGLCWTLTGDRLAFLDSYKAIDRLQEEADEGTLDKLLETRLVEPEQSVLAEIDPEPGLQEQLDEAFAAKLADMKEAMSDVQIAELVGKTKEFNTWSELSSAHSLLDMVKAVNVGELSEEAAEAKVNDEDSDGIRCITSVIPDAPYVSSEILLEAGTLDYDEIHDFVFLGELLGSLPTEKYTADELDAELNRCLYKWSIGPSLIYDAKTGDPHPYLSVDSMELTENIKESRALLDEVLHHTDFSDADRIRYLASDAVTGYVSENTQDPATIAYISANAAANPSQRYAYHAMQFDYLAYLKEVARMNDSEIKALAGRLQDVLHKLLNKNGAIYTAAGSEESIRADRKEAESWIGMLDDSELEMADYSEELDKLELPKRIAISVPGSVNYNGIAALHEDTGLKDSGSDAVVFSVLKNQLLYPAFRYNIGAYGYLQRVGQFATIMLTYRDPDVQPSFDFFDSLPEQISALELTQEEINDSILNVYSEYAYPSSPLSLAQTEISYVLQNKPETFAEELVKKMKEAKEVTPEDVTAASGKVQKLLESGSRVTAGNSAVIKKNQELYDLVIEDLTK